VKTIIKLVIAGIILNACARGGQAAWQYYQLKDQAQQTLIFGADATMRQIHDQIMRRAAELDVPLPSEGLEITRDGSRTMARAAYTQPVELFPRYRYPFKFSFNVDALSVKPTKAEDLVAP
jgi:hypothetical protein